MFRFFENFDLGGNCFEKKKMDIFLEFFFKIFKILKDPPALIKKSDFPTLCKNCIGI